MTTLRDSDMFVDVDAAKKHRDNLERIRKLERERNLGDRRKTREPEFILQKVRSVIDHNPANTPESGSRIPPTKVDHRGNIKGRHFNKTITKVGMVVELYNRGLGIAKVANELHLAKHTVVNMLEEHKGALLDAEKILSNQKQIKVSKNNIIKALRCLVAADKKSPRTAIELCKSGMDLLQKYLTSQPADTVRLLIGDNTFGIDDLLNAVATIIVRETMKLHDDFVEIAPDKFQLKTSLERQNQQQEITERTD